MWDGYSMRHLKLSDFVTDGLEIMCKAGCVFSILAGEGSRGGRCQFHALQSISVVVGDPSGGSVGYNIRRNEWFKDGNLGRVLLYRIILAVRSRLSAVYYPVVQ